jgi:hypothetical protein
VAGVNYFGVCGLDQSSEQRAVRFASRSAAKAIENTFYSRLRGDFPAIMPAHTVGHSKKPTMRANAFRRVGLDGT